MMPLSLAQVGEENIIKRIGGSPEVKEARVAISKEMAVKIMV